MRPIIPLIAKALTAPEPIHRSWGFGEETNACREGESLRRGGYGIPPLRVSGVGAITTARRMPATAPRGRTCFLAFSTALKRCGIQQCGIRVDQGRATEMNLEILEEYIQQEWAPDFHYAHYESIPWTPFLKTSDTACVALVTTGGVHLRQTPPFAGIDDASSREIPGTAQASELTVSHPFFDNTELEQD